MKIKRKIIEIDEELCNGCGQCVPSCAEGALKIVNGKARLVSEVYCDGLGACLGECPTGALRIVEREADNFDEEVVEKHLTSTTLACGCPSTQIQSFVPSSSCAEANRPLSQEAAVSTLSHWPVQIRLVPANAPFLKGADLLVAADCTPVAYPHFHRDFLQGKVVMVGCPKFDDAQGYIQRFAEIFKTADIKGITVVVMEVPCCQGLPVIIKKGMELAGKEIPLDQVIINTRGEILDRERLVA
ncbi:MAG TPA: 4Fe-4S binding protein [Desulfatiglandales bacterium]|nr:4Fe-4S binding protein [Desulfatiglandales bacterium]